MERLRWLLKGWLHPIQKRRALLDYWTAKTPEQERDAYLRMRQFGWPASYGENW